MATKSSDKKKTKPPAKKSKGKKKNKYLKYFIILLVLCGLGLLAYKYLAKKNIPQIPVKKIVKSAEKLWTETVNTVSTTKTDSIPAEKEPEIINTNSNPKPITGDRVKLFTEQITPAVKKVIALPYRSGASPEIDNATDNSHLIFYIWQTAAQKSGLSIGKYRPMHELVQHCTEISLSQLSNGDLIVLKDGNAGLIYAFGEETDGFFLTYVSEKSQKVVSVPSQELKKYWLNPRLKKGYYRVTKEIFK